LRSKQEELQFCYGVNSSDDDDDDENTAKKDRIANTDKKDRLDKPSAKKSTKKNVKFDWIPPNVSTNLVIFFPTNFL
jgi:hypothetical protein